MRSHIFVALSALLSASAPALRAQSMPGMDVSAADGAMSGHLMPMAHMTMTKLGPMHAGDAPRAAAIADTVKGAIEKYRDYRVALDEGFTIFHAEIPQKVYHFTSKSNGLKSIFTFDPARPTSLLYAKTANHYKLVGAMFTAPRRYTLEQLNERVPVSVAEWHMHTNLCLPPRGAGEQAILPAGKVPARFGLRGTIVTEEACSAAGGRFLPTVFGWMVHVSPWEKDPSLVWGTHEDDDHEVRTGH